LKVDKNPYIKANIEYFNKRKEICIGAKFRATIFNKYKQICPICEQSLHNGELVELYHIPPQKSGAKYSMNNILPLHQICHQQINHDNQNLERFQIAQSKREKTESTSDKST
jgi:hypothetical protein